MTLKYAAVFIAIVALMASTVHADGQMYLSPSAAAVWNHVLESPRLNKHFLECTVALPDGDNSAISDIKHGVYTFKLYTNIGENFASVSTYEDWLAITCYGHVPMNSIPGTFVTVVEEKARQNAEAFLSENFTEFNDATVDKVLDVKPPQGPIGWRQYIWTFRKSGVDIGEAEADVEPDGFICGFSAPRFMSKAIITAIPPAPTESDVRESILNDLFAASYLEPTIGQLRRSFRINNASMDMIWAGDADVVDKAGAKLHIWFNYLEKDKTIIVLNIAPRIGQDLIIPQNAPLLLRPSEMMAFDPRWIAAGTSVWWLGEMAPSWLPIDADPHEGAVGYRLLNSDILTKQTTFFLGERPETTDPSPSPDGRWMAANVGDGSVMIDLNNGVAHRYGDGSGPLCWAPDSNRAVAGAGRLGVTLVKRGNESGEPEWKIQYLPIAGMVADADFVPGSSEEVLVAYLPTSQEQDKNGWQIIRISITEPDLGKAVVIRKGLSAIHHFHRGPGKQMWLSLDDGVHSLDIDTGALTTVDWLANNATVIDHYIIDSSNVEWDVSPHGDRVVFTASRMINNTGLFVCDIDGKNPTRISPDDCLDITTPYVMPCGLTDLHVDTLPESFDGSLEYGQQWPDIRPRGAWDRATPPRGTATASTSGGGGG